jgi:hypothetical protein
VTNLDCGLFPSPRGGEVLEAEDGLPIMEAT